MKEEFVRVPFYVEKDGSKTFFLPNCRATGGFKIGPKGSEEQFADYWTALSRLSSMQTPRFRRRNTEGNFGIVKCEAGALEDVRSDFIMAELAKHG
jgi:hypothetical protein